MAYKLAIPRDQIMPETACFFRTHLGHREGAVDLVTKLIEKAATIEREDYGDDPLLNEFGGIAERWAIYTLIQGCYVREYHEWERAVKKYLTSQCGWNGIPDGFDWTSGRKTFVSRTMDALAPFSASMDQTVMDSIDNVRRKVNYIKHDPLDHDVERADYDDAIKAFANFWDKMMELEGMPAALSASPRR